MLRTSAKPILLAAAAALWGIVVLAGSVALAHEPTPPNHALPVRSPQEVVVTGRAEPGLAAFDRLMTRFLAENHVPGAALAVTRQGRLVYARGFGEADLETHEPVRPESLFRIASVSKPITAVAVLQLAERGKLKLDEPMLQALDPALVGEVADPRTAKITIRELLQHRGGFDRDASFDPMFRPLRTARQMNEPPPAGPNTIIRSMFRRKLDFDPGEKSVYSNFGYCLLGRAVEHAGGQSYESYVREHVLAPLGIHDMRLGHSLREGRAAGEVTYYDAQGKTARCVLGPEAGKPVPTPYGSYYLEAMDAHGGWVGSAVDLVRFASAFDNPAWCPVLSAQGIATMFARPPGRAGANGKERPRRTYYACGWQVGHFGPGGAITTWHAGYLDGQSSLLVRRFDGLDWAVLFNTDHTPSGDELLSDVIDPLIHEAADSVSEWPEVDLPPKSLLKSKTSGF